MPKQVATNQGETRRQQLKLLMWPLIVALLFGLGGLGEPLEDGLRVLRNKTHVSNASGDIVLIQIDDKSRRAVGEWPWRRSVQAQMYARAHQLGAKQIIADINYAGPSTPVEDKAFADTLESIGNVTLAVVTRIGADEGGTGKGKEAEGKIFAPFEQRAKLGTLSTNYNWQGAVWQVPSVLENKGRLIPSLAWKASQRPVPAQTNSYRIDYSIDPSSVPVFSASDLIQGRVAKSAIAGKTVMIGTNSVAIGDQFQLPGWEKTGGVYMHILGAETLKRGLPAELSWWPALLIAAIAAWVAVRRERLSLLLLTGSATLLLPLALEQWLLFPQIVPALALSSIVAARMAWRRLRSGGLVNGLTGLPNLTALRQIKHSKDMPLVGVRIHNYAEIASTLNADGEKQLVEQVIQRFNIGNKERTIYQGDEGIFAWFAEKDTPFASQLEALHALFRSPVRVDKVSYDIALSFGVELGSSRSISSRLGSALVAAQEADAESLKWKFYDPARLQEVPWRLSLLSQLDEAIANGEVWLAYQPKLDLETRQTVGAEALARWTHPEKGPISPSEFISAAEQSDRIEHLTDFVLDQAIAAAARIVRDGNDFDIAVNLSARLLGDRSLPDRVTGFLTKHGLPPHRLTLELTETAAVAGTGMGLDILVRLRDAGVKIAIDDYGTGLSTLEYLKKVPASEIKIDQSFIRSMRDNRSDLIMVQSTITLAKSLGRTVVAEGVEDALSLEQLKTMGCDLVQGFIVGRPMPFNELARRLATEKRRSSAA